MIVHFLFLFPLSDVYGSSTLSLKKFDRVVRKLFQACIKDTGWDFSARGVEGAAGLMSKCLRVNPEERMKADELLKDEWLSS
jgi:serine/threonine protein kinase